MQRSVAPFLSLLLLGLALVTAQQPKRRAADGPLFYDDVQRGIHAYNGLWWSLEFCGPTFPCDSSDPASNCTPQRECLEALLPLFVAQDFTFILNSLPLPPFFNTTFNVPPAVGLDAVIDLAAGINPGEFHVYHPPSVEDVTPSAWLEEEPPAYLWDRVAQLLRFSDPSYPNEEERVLYRRRESSARLYRMTTKDLDLTRNPQSQGGGCTTYYSQKTTFFEVRDCGFWERCAVLLNSTDDVVTADSQGPPCGNVWNPTPFLTYSVCSSPWWKVPHLERSKALLSQLARR